jgi:glycosyltransferase involved in cell wall biosynthesis
MAGFGRRYVIVPYTFEYANLKYPKETKGLISIIIPIYNAELYLREALDSVITQTFENWEAILVNDGSTDKSPKICMEYAEKDFRFKYIYKEHNEGLLLARKMGLENAIGEFIANLDSDDTYHPQFLEKMFSKIKENNSDFVYCNLKDMNGNRKYSVVKDCGLNDSKIKNCYNIKKYNNSVCNKLIKRDVYAKIIFPQTFIINAEDMIQTLQIIYHSKYTECISDNLYLYRLDSFTSVINTLNTESKEKGYVRRVIGIIAVYKIAEKFLSNDEAENFLPNMGIYECISLACYFLTNKDTIASHKIEYAENFARKLLKSKRISMFFKVILILASKGFTLPLKILNQANLRLKKINWIYVIYKEIQGILR